MKASALLLVFMTLAQPATAEECTCLAHGRSFAQGETACLKLPSGLHLARCDRVLNTSSWTALPDTCDTAEMHDRAAASAAAATAEEPVEAWPEGALFSACLGRDLRMPAPQ